MSSRKATIMYYFNHQHFKSFFLLNNDQDKHRINWKSCPHISAKKSFTFSGFQVVEMLEGRADEAGCPINSAPRSSLSLSSYYHNYHNYHKLFLWRKNCHVEKLWRNLGKFWEILRNIGKKMGDVATIYALSCGEKLSPKSTFVEKKWQIWGLVTY